MAAAPRAGTHTEPRFERKNQIKSTKNVALHFRAGATPLQAKSMTYATSTRANCRRWVSGVPTRRKGIGVREVAQANAADQRRNAMRGPALSGRLEGCPLWFSDKTPFGEIVLPRSS